MADTVEFRDRPSPVHIDAESATRRSRAARLRACGGCPKVRRNARRMRSGSENPVLLAMRSIVNRSASTRMRAVSARSRSIARAGD